jgi:4-amino-4-deoxy-L-arabinose transferase-like glycosyltransferase
MKRSTTLLLIGIVCISIFFRFYKLSELFYFSLDEEVISFNIRQITQGSHFPAIGVNAADTGLYLGPGYFYIATPFFKLLNNSPLGGAIMSSVIGVCTTLTLFWLVMKVFNDEHAALLTSLFHASSLTIALFERKFFNAQPVIILSSIIIGLTYVVVKNKNIHAFWLLAFCMGLIFHINLMLVPYIICVVILMYISRVNLNIKNIILGILIFIFTISPLIFFDIRHNFQLTKKIFSPPKITNQSILKHTPFSLNKINTLIQFPAKIISQKQLFSNNIVQESVTCMQAPKNTANAVGITIFVIGLITYCIFMIKNRTNNYLTIFILCCVFSIIIYPGIIREYYYQMLTPLILLVTGKGFSLLLNQKNNVVKCIAATVIFINVGINTSQILRVYNPHSFSKMTELSQYIIERVKQPYRLQFNGDSCYGYGFDYLLTVKNFQAANSFEDPIIGWLKDNGQRQNSETTTNESQVYIFADQNHLVIKDTTP